MCFSFHLLTRYLKSSVELRGASCLVFCVHLCVFSILAWKSAPAVAQSSNMCSETGPYNYVVFPEVGDQVPQPCQINSQEFPTRLVLGPGSHSQLMPKLRDPQELQQAGPQSWLSLLEDAVAFPPPALDLTLLPTLGDLWEPLPGPTLLGVLGVLQPNKPQAFC